MTTLRNINLKTVHQLCSSNTAVVNLTGQVPAGMTRWFTMARLENTTGAGSAVAVHLASVSQSDPGLASIVLTSNRKMQINLRELDGSGLNSEGLVQVPRVPNLDAPLFSIAAEQWLGVAATLTTGLLTLQYFDE